jgi:plastocyanin
MLSIQIDRGRLQGAQFSPRLRRPALMAAAFVALFFTGTFWLAGSQAEAASNTIEISNFSFAPAVLTVPVGTTVTWVNDDDEPHTVVESDTLFKSHALDTGDKFSFIFTTPGKFQYFCTIHAHMVGTVVVEASKQSP